MINLSVFDEEFVLIREPKEDRHFDLALELSNHFRGKATTLSADAEEMLWVEQSKFRTTFIKTMLFADAELDLIAECMDMKEELVLCYKELFFDMSQVRGQLGKTEVYETIFATYKEGTKEHSFGIMLRDAHLGGVEIILAQFNITIGHHSVADYKERQTALLQWRLDTTDRGDRDYEELTKEIKARDATLAAIAKAASTDDKAKMSDLASLVKILEHMNEKDMGRGQLQVRAFDTKTEEVIDVDASLLTTPAQKIEENE